MALNARAAGVVALPGLQYKVLKSGPADAPHPKLSDDVTLNYEGALNDGKIFDSSFQHGEPSTFALKQLIPGWEIAVRQMRLGDEWLVYIPPEMAYGAAARGPIPANSVLVFRIQLIDAKPHPK